ncbi:copper resistance CopC/CopD family protein [Ktedonobacter racemifer]|uniref:Copper resistance protein CopC n=1 Tax=Ktedonobacter racemifer DSM 44963 TaxID=485913 RepID=D6U6K2_KTERA|nr:copper resistance protein CopC [Ktedonobacter racemifer]EFH80613.1 copper resistance protein CopC [Ktedonobacter racemifer DSM 44963]
MDRQHGGRRQYGFVLSIALLLAGLVMFLPGKAHAQALHAVLLSSSPAEGSVLAHSPSTVRLWFSEPVQLVGQSLTIFAPSGDAIRQETIQVRGQEISMPLKASTEGTYLVNWQVISEDTDPTSGSFTFSIGHPGGAWAGTVSDNTSATGFWLQILAHLLHFLGYALSFGVLAFLRLVVYPAVPSQRETLQQPIWRLVNLGILVLLLAEGAALIAQSASLRGHAIFDLAFIVTILGSSFGRVLALRLGAALTLWILVGIAQQGSKRAVTLSLVLGGVSAFIDSDASHAISSQMAWLALLATTLHITAMGVWLGGLIALLTLWRLQATKAYRNALLLRFGPLALASVAELFLTGIVLSWLHLAQVTDLFTTSYGRVLGIKALALFLPLLFAMLSNWQQQPSRKRWWLLEALSLLGMLVLAATLVSLPAPR